MGQRVVDRATEIIKPIVESMGYVFVDLEYKKEYSGYVLALTIDKEGGVDLNDCERVSKALDKPLDENDITNGASYNFNVSSYGLDRVFKTDYDFNKHLGTLVDVKFYAPFNGSKQLLGVLSGFNSDSVKIDETNIDKKIIASISAHLDF